MATAKLTLAVAIPEDDCSSGDDHHQIMTSHNNLHHHHENGGNIHYTQKNKNGTNLAHRSQTQQQSSKERKERKERYKSAPFSAAEAQSQPEHSAAFPKSFTHSGYLDIRTKKTRPWKRRYFVLNNNFLLCAATPHAKKLEYCYPLEGSSVNKKSSKRKSSRTSPPSPASPSDNMTFQLFIRKHVLHFRAASPQQCATWKEHIAKAAKLKIKDIYRFLYSLGTSESQSTKVVAAKHRTTKDDCAIKIVDKRNCEAKMLKTEISILKKLDNPYVVQLYDIFETKKYLYIVMEKCQGGELFDQIAELDGEHYTEQDCCHVMHQIAKGVKYMHEIGIVHRDLKPENILCVHANSIKRIKIADFGISKMVKNENGKQQKQNNEQMMHTMVGTLSYTAPEILRGKGYDQSVDYWSIGVIMFILLCGYPPFWGSSDDEISRAVLKDDIIFEDEDWEHVTPETKKLVAGLLDKDPSKRLSTNHVLKLAWKVSSKNVAFKKSRAKFKQTVLERKFHRHSMGTFERNSTLLGKVTAHDTTNHNNSKQKILNDYNRNTKSWRGRRGSKTAEEILELQLPITKRDSLMQHFETDDDVRKRKKKQMEEAQQMQFMQQYGTGARDSDCDDDDDQKAE